MFVVLLLLLPLLLLLLFLIPLCCFELISNASSSFSCSLHPLIHAAWLLLGRTYGQTTARQHEQRRQPKVYVRIPWAAVAAILCAWPSFLPCFEVRSLLLLPLFTLQSGINCCCYFPLLFSAHLLLPLLLLQISAVYVMSSVSQVDPLECLPARLVLQLVTLGVILPSCSSCIRKIRV